MRHTTTVSESFEAGHQLDDPETCRWAHGHRWTVSVTVEGTLDARKVYVVDHRAFLAALRAVVDELRDRSLNDMLPGVRPTPEGLAIYFHERLALVQPRIVAVSVGMGEGVQVRVEWDVR